MTYKAVFQLMMTSVSSPVMTLRDSLLCFPAVAEMSPYELLLSPRGGASHQKTSQTLASVHSNEPDSHIKPVRSQV